MYLVYYCKRCGRMIAKEINGEQRYLLELSRGVQKEFFDRVIKLVQKENKNND